MSINYLYVSQRDEDPSSVIISDYRSLQPNVRDMKFMVMHCGGDIMGCVGRFLTRGGYMYTQAAAFAPSSIASQTFRLTQSKPFPLSDLYLVLGPLQSEVIMKIYHRQPFDVDMKALVEGVEKMSTLVAGIMKDKEDGDKLLATVVTENMEMRREMEVLSGMIASQTLLISEMTDRLIGMNERAMAQADKVSSQDERIASQDDRIASQDDRIASLMDRLTIAEAEIQSLKCTLAHGVIIDRDYFAESDEGADSDKGDEGNEGDAELPTVETMTAETATAETTTSDDAPTTDQKTSTIWGRWF